MTGRDLLDTDRYETNQNILGRERKKTENLSVDSDPQSKLGKKKVGSENLSLDGSNMVSHRITNVRYLNDPANISTSTIPNMHHLTLKQLKAQKSPSANKVLPESMLSHAPISNLGNSVELASSPIKEDLEDLE